MDWLFILLMVALLAFMISKNISLFKRNKHLKGYIACTDGIFNKSEDKVSIIENYISLEEESEFKNKARVLLIYAKLDEGLDTKEDVALLDLKDTIYDDKNKVDLKKFEFNSDTYFWMIVALIKAHTANNEECFEGLHNAIDKYYMTVNSDIVITLFNNIYHTLKGDSLDYTYLKDLWSGVYPSGATYDKRLIGFYKYLAITILAYKNEEISEDMKLDLQNFAQMKAGKIILNDLGILSEYEIEEDEEVKDLETPEEKELEETSEDKEESDDQCA